MAKLIRSRYLAPVHASLHILPIQRTLLRLLATFTTLSQKAVHLAAMIAAVHIQAVNVPTAAAMAHIATSCKIILSIGHTFSQP